MTPAIDRPCRGPRSPWTSAAAATVAAALFAGVVGCDDRGETADLAAQAKATAALRVGGAPSDETIKDLEAIASKDRATPVVVQSRHSLAQAKLDLAIAKADDLAALENGATAMLYNIAATTNQAQTTATLGAAYLKLDPKASIAQLVKMSAAAKGNGNAATFETVPDATIPTLAAVDQEKSRLEGELAKQTSQQAELTKQRDEKLSAAGESSAKADREKGEARLTLVKEVAAARQAAAETSRQLSALELQLEQTKADLAVQDALKAQLGDAVASFDQQATVVKAGWTEVSKKANLLNSQAKTTLDGKDASVRTMAAAFAEQAKAIADQRDTVDKMFEDAINAFTSAGTLANTLTTDLSNARSQGGQAFEAAAWDAEAKLFAADPINLDKASAQRSLAGFRANGARFLAREMLVAAAIERAGKPLGVNRPDPLFDPFKLKTSVADALKAADGSYGDALSTLEGVTLGSGDLATLKPERDTLKILSMYDRGNLARMAKDLGVAPELAVNEKMIADAKAAAVESQSNDVMLPRLPAAITPPAAPKPPAEGAAPAEGATPAATPTEGAAPAAPAATPVPADAAPAAAPAATPPAAAPAAVEGVAPAQ